MRVEIVAGGALGVLNDRLGTAAVPGHYVREMGAMGRVAGRPRRVLSWNFVDAAGRVAFRLSAAEYEAFMADGVLRAG